MNNKDKTRIVNLTSALYKRDREVSEACKLLRDVCDILACAQNALQALRGATLRDEGRRCVVEERISMAVERCQKFREDHSNPF